MKASNVFRKGVVTEIQKLQVACPKFNNGFATATLLLQLGHVRPKGCIYQYSKNLTANKVPIEIVQSQGTDFGFLETQITENPPRLMLERPWAKKNANLQQSARIRKACGVLSDFL